MPRKYVRKGNSGRGEWSEDNLRCAVELVTSGKISKREAERLYKVPARTISRRILTGKITKPCLGPQGINTVFFINYIFRVLIN
jgi:hypothetical protein